MSEGGHHAVPSRELDAAEFAGAGIGRGSGGMTLKEIAAHVSAFFKNPKRRTHNQSHFGWQNRRMKLAEQQRAARPFAAAQVHPLRTGVRKFKVKSPQPQ